MARRIALALHGAGSDGDFVLRCFRAGDLAVDEVVAIEHRDAETRTLLTIITRQVEAARARGDEVTFPAGVSLGAHAVATWTARAGAHTEISGLLLVMPAWTGSPTFVAAATAAAASDVLSLGSAAIIERLKGESPRDWVVDAVASSWPRYGDPVLAASLLTASRSPGPTSAELASIRVPSAIVCLDDDALHPRAVAEHWHSVIPASALESLPRDLGGRRPDVLGQAAIRALARLSESQ